MEKYAELRDALNQFRELFRRKILPFDAINGNGDFLRRMRTTESPWTDSEASKVYWILKPYTERLKIVGCDFRRVPLVKMEVQRSEQPPVKQITFVEPYFVIHTPYRQEIIDAIRNLTGRIYHSETKTWRVPLDQAQNLLDFAAKFGFLIGNKAEKIMRDIHTNVADSYKSEYVELNLPLKLPLFPFQTAGADYAIRNKRVIIADEMGLGKTVQAIATTLGTGAFPALVICPKSLRYNWQDEWSKFTDHKAEVLNAKINKNLPEYLQMGVFDVVVTNYEGIVSYFAKEIQEVIQPTEGEIFEKCKVKYVGPPFEGFDKDDNRWKKMEVIQVDKSLVTVIFEKGKKGIPDKTLVFSISDLKKVRIIKKPILNGTEKLFRTVILDEGHECRNKTTIRYKAVAQAFKEKEIRLILSGTPIVKGPEDIATLIELLGRIDEFGGYAEFIKTYTGLSVKDYGKAKNKKYDAARLQALNVKLRTSCFIRREKHQVLKELPDKFRQIIKVDIDTQTEYTTAWLDLMNYLVMKSRTSKEIERAMRAEMLVRLNILKQISGRGKISALKEFAESLPDGEKLIVFTWFLETSQALKKEFPLAVSITGQDTDEQVEANKKKFQEDPDCPMIIVSYKRGGMGHTLTASSKVVLLELGWTYKDQVQAEDRAHRIGQKESVNCYYILGKDTIDEDIYQIIESRREMEKNATGGTSDIETSTVDALTTKLIGIANKK